MTHGVTWILAACGLILWGLFAVALFRFSPSDVGGMAPFVLSGVLWGALAVTATGMGIMARRLLPNQDVEARIIGRSFRQAIWLASLCVTALWLSHVGLLTFLVSVLLIALFALLELWFLSFRR